MKYKVGDRVKIQSLERYNKYKNRYGDINYGCETEILFTSEMSSFCGQVVTITRVRYIGCVRFYHLAEDKGDHLWVDGMFEGLVEKERDDKLKLESTKKVREYWSEYTRIFIEIYDDKPNECILTHLHTLEKYRQKGYARKALAEAELIAKELGCHTAYLKVETNSWMHHWYLRCGYNWNKNADEGYTWLTKNL